jgi:hypothetical protein
LDQAESLQTGSVSVAGDDETGRRGSIQAAVAKASDDESDIDKEKKPAAHAGR